MILKLEPLTTSAFQPFGDVIEIKGEPSFPINGGTTARYHDLGKIQIESDGDRSAISMARGNGYQYPIEIKMLERHPKGSQAWIPSNATPFVVVVAENGDDDKPNEQTLRAFFAQGHQGVNYHKGTWHHPLLTYSEGQGDFIVIDRIGKGNNCDEVDLSQCYVVTGEYKDSI